MNAVSMISYASHQGKNASAKLVSVFVYWPRTFVRSGALSQYRYSDSVKYGPPTGLLQTSIWPVSLSDVPADSASQFLRNFARKLIIC